MNEIVESKNIKATEYGIEFTGKPTIKEWHQAVQAVQKINGLCQWYLGDLIVYAESPVTGWGESKYADLLDATGYEYGTLMNYARTARRFPPEFREAILSNVNIRNLSFEHFYQVASLSDERAIYFLEMVRDGGWSVAKLRQEIAMSKNGGRLPEPKERDFVDPPDGFERAKSNDFYIPAPEPVGERDYRTTCKIELEDWEAKLVFNLIKDNPKLISLAGRLSLFLESA